MMGLQQPINVVGRSGQLLGIIGTELVAVLDAPNAIHRELANLYGDDASVVKFVQRWGRVTSGEPFSPPTLNNTKELFIGPMAEAAEALRAAHPQSAMDWNAPVVFAETVQAIIQLRDLLQKAWRGNATALAALRRTVEQVGSTWSFKDGRIEITAHDAWIAVCVLFLNDYAKGFAAVCGNPKCLAPFFIKTRSSQKFCGNDACAVFGQRAGANRWWDEHGSQWREKKRKAARTKGRK